MLLPEQACPRCQLPTSQSHLPAAQLPASLALVCAPTASHQPSAHDRNTGFPCPSPEETDVYRLGTNWRIFASTTRHRCLPQSGHVVNRNSFPISLFPHTCQVSNKTEESRSMQLSMEKEKSSDMLLRFRGIYLVGKIVDICLAPNLFCKALLSFNWKLFSNNMIHLKQSRAT